MHPPAYFERVRSKATEVLALYDKEPDLRGPRDQLFRQLVHRPDHVLSELLQNADDAGATSATLTLDGRHFELQHDGADFTEPQFAALCSFGRSSKRTLHSIGFRGIGFKSVFSLAPRVLLRTPTLAVSFLRERFTEPRWEPSATPTDGRTIIALDVESDPLAEALTRLMAQWEDAAHSLLFFRSLRSLTINGSTLAWERAGPGPVPRSEWVRQAGTEDKPLLVITSEPTPLPRECLEEIQVEGRFSMEDGDPVPDYELSLVLGAAGRLHVGLPTDVQLPTEFALNAPCILDPARQSIKSPAGSVTNRLLLNQAGELAARALVAWVNDQSLALEDRARAYALLPDDADDDAPTHSRECTAELQAGTRSILASNAFLLCMDGSVAQGGVVDLGTEVPRIWPEHADARRLAPDGAAILSGTIKGVHRTRLASTRYVKAVTTSEVLERTLGVQMPTPASFERLTLLWDLVTAGFKGWRSRDWFQLLQVVPVIGSDVLLNSMDVVRLPSATAGDAAPHWSFLGRFVQHVDAAIIAAIVPKEARSEKERRRSELLSLLGLNVESTPHRTFQLAWRRARGTHLDGEMLVRFARCAAHFDLEVPADFAYLSLGGRVIDGPQASDCLWDPDGTLQEVLDPAWYTDHCISQEYLRQLAPRERDRWTAWARSRKSGLRRLPAPQPIAFTFSSIPAFEARIEALGGVPPEQYPRTRGLGRYRKQQLVIHDYLPSPAWRPSASWRDDDRVRGNLGRLFVLCAHEEMEPFTRLVATMTTTGGANPARVSIGDVPTAWVRTIADQVLLPDRSGTLHVPSELMLRTASTEHLLGSTPFVHGDLDSAITRFALEALGVQTRPSGCARLLSRLRTLSRDSQALESALGCLRAINGAWEESPAEEQEEVKRAFLLEPLVPARDASWHPATDVYVRGDESLHPGAHTVHPDVGALALWSLVGVPGAPSEADALEWMRMRTSDGRLTSPDRLRAQAICRRLGSRVWEEANCWLAYDERVREARDFRWALTASCRVPGSLYSHVEAELADLRMLAVHPDGDTALARLPRLGDRLGWQVANDSGTALKALPTWLEAFADTALRHVLPTPEATVALHAASVRLRGSALLELDALHVIPTYGGQPIGTAEARDTAWVHNRLHVQRDSPHRQRGALVREISSALPREAHEALAFSQDRPAEAIKEWFVEHFERFEGPVSAALAADAETGPAVSTAPGVPEHLPEYQAQVGEDHAVRAYAVPEAEPREDSATDARVAPPGPPLEAPATRPVPATDIVAATDHPDSASLAELYFRSLGWLSQEGWWVSPDGRIRVAPEAKGSRTWRSEPDEEGSTWVYRFETVDPRKSSLLMDAALWYELERLPSLVTLVGMDEHESPMPYSGTQLLALQARGGLTLNPASFRLRIHS